ncbi:MBL fold metallo-hydrolase [bacterium]|nr:MBL fold metallo-hydrolase [bacterium]MBU1982855.1 MBL fold metallo-hydrolase [bacterium]
MILEQISTAGDRNFGYLIADPDAKVCAVVDPSGAPQKFVERIRALDFRLQWIICTHHHSDHTSGARELKLLFDAPVALHRSAQTPHDVSLDDGQELELGKLRVRVIHTPGHTPDSICLSVPGAVLTGDTLFVGKVGGTDFGEGARRQYHSLHEKLLVLPEDTKVYPGHDVGIRPVSTIREERAQNPFLLRPDFESFVDLKRNWLAYKAQHGIQ